VDQLGWVDAEALLTPNNLEPAYCLRASAAKGWDASQLAARLTECAPIIAIVIATIIAIAIIIIMIKGCPPTTCAHLRLNDGTRLSSPPASPSAHQS
jgi:hypothetical protein